MAEGAQAAAVPAPATSPERVTVDSPAALAVLGVSLLATLTIPGSLPGLGLAVCSSAMLAAAAVGSGIRSDPWRAALLAISAALAATPVLRDAEWLVALSISLAFVFGSIALIGSASWRGLAQVTSGMFIGPFAGPLEVIRSAVTRIPAFDTGGVSSVLKGSLLAAVLVTVFAALFASADEAFSELLQGLSPDLALEGLDERIGVALLALVAGGALAYIAATRSGGGFDDRDEAGGEWPFGLGPEETGVGATEWGIALGALVALFAAFVGVQFVVLFGGQDHVLETSGLTYAEYAREGFFQLLVASALVLAVVAGGLRWARVGGEGQAKLLKGLLAALCVLTLVVLVSAAHRLDLYVDAFGATRARLVAFAVCLWVAAALVATFVSLFTERRSWVPRAICLVSVSIALGMAIGNPDGWIAKRNVDRHAASGSFDRGYNSGLSADAVPALAELPSPLRDDVTEEQADRLEERDGIWGANVGRARARAALP